MILRRAGLAAATGLLAAPALAAACAWPAAFVSGSAAPVTVATVATLDRERPIAALVATLGPAARDVGSGVHVLEWDVDDGRVFRVSVVDACSRPLAAGFAPGAAPARSARGLDAVTARAPGVAPACGRRAGIPCAFGRTATATALPCPFRSDATRSRR